MNSLPEAKQVQILRCLTEGMAVRATARVTGVSKNAVLRLIKRVGPWCEWFHHRFVHDVPCKRLELDELHQFVYAKQKCLRARPPAAIVQHFRGPMIDYATVDKDFDGGGDPKRPESRYAPGKIRRITKKVVIGDPDPAYMTTSHCERLNLTVRMQNKRYARLTNAHSKRITYHVWALAMQVFFYNWCRVNAAVKGTPAQAARLTDYRFEIADMLRLEMWAGEEMLQVVN